MEDGPAVAHPGDGAQVRSTAALLTDRGDAVARTFYATLFALDPPVRELFPAAMTTQRDRLVTALLHVAGLVDDPDRLVPFLAQLGRDHRKHGVLAEHYDSVGTALLAALRQHAGPGWSDEVARAWSRTWDTVATVMAGAAAAERGPATWGATVVEHHRVSDDLAVVRLLADTPVPHTAGQYLSVQVPQRPRTWRWFSPAGAPDGTGELELHVRAVPGGWVSPAVVRHTRVGDRWLVGPAMGRLSVDRACGRDVLMVAGGTGLAPLRAIVAQMARKGVNPRVQLFVGGRTRADLHDLDTLQQLATTNPWLTVVPVVQERASRHGTPEPRPAGMHTVLHGTLAEVVSGMGSWADRQVLLSGSPGMVRATITAMTAAGTPLEQMRWDPLPPA